MKRSLAEELAVDGGLTQAKASKPNKEDEHSQLSQSTTSSSGNSQEILQSPSRSTSCKQEAEDVDTNWRGTEAAAPNDNADIALEPTNSWSSNVGAETGKAPASEMQEAEGSAGIRLHDETVNVLLQKLLRNADFQQLAKHLLGAADGGLPQAKVSKPKTAEVCGQGSENTSSSSRGSGSVAYVPRDSDSLAEREIWQSPSQSTSCKQEAEDATRNWRGTEAAAPNDHADIALEPNNPSGKNDVGAKNGTAPPMPGIQEAEGAEGSAGIRVYEETVDSLLQKLRNEEFQQIAKQLLHKKGMRLDNMLPRMAVEIFLQRYSNSERADHYFTHEQTRQGVIATLVTPSFFGSSFRGPAMYTQTQAEISACQLFVTDKYVLEAAEWLPPPMETIRKRVALSKHQKQVLRERGYDTTVVQRDLLNCVYAGFRSLGCRSAIFDNNA
ncbi:unnamed protein product [Symbiodinium sp. CCMP2592]|nr:unnamed protein product [Symbiodinium sp. CCMP2592]